MVKFFCKCFEVVMIVAVVAVGVFFFGAFIKLILEPLAPVVTILVVLLFTLFTFNGWITAILSVGGIALYVASWTAVSTWGVCPGMFVWSLGVLLWFSAVYKSLIAHMPIARTATV